MRTPFDRLLAMADRANDRVNAETFVLMPMIRPANGRPVADPDRPAVTGRGIFDFRGGEAGGIQTGNRSHYRGRNDLKR